jgi:hypothetical protein
MKNFKKTFHLFLLILLLSIYCGSPTNNEEYLKNSYFPLKIGNRWYYNTSFPDTTTTDEIWDIIGKVEQNNKSYYEFVISYPSSAIKNTVYYRMNGDTLFYQGINDNKEHIIADFSLNLNDTTYWQSDLKVVLKTDSIIKYATPFSIDYGASITFKKNLGITDQISNGIIYYRLKLISAEIR